MPAHVPGPQGLQHAQTAAAVKAQLGTPGDVTLTPVALLDPAHMSIDDAAGRMVGYLNFEEPAIIAAAPDNKPGDVPVAGFQLESNSPYAPQVFSNYTVLPDFVMTVPVKANTAYAIDCTVEAHGAHYELGSWILDKPQRGDVAFTQDPDESIESHLVIATPRTNNYWNAPDGNLTLVVYLKSGKPQRSTDMWWLMKEPSKYFYGCRVYSYVQVAHLNSPGPLRPLPVGKPGPSLPPAH